MHTVNDLCVAKMKYIKGNMEKNCNILVHIHIEAGLNPFSE